MAAGAAGPAGGTPRAGVLIGDRLYSGVLITLENCLLPDDRLRFTPSMSSGLDTDTETGLRVVGCELIQAAGILLRLPQVAMATGQVLFQRFFYTKSFVKHSMEHVSMACVHLASKIEEAPRRIRDVVNVFHRLRHLREKRKPVPMLLDQDYVGLKNQVIKAERRVLKELGFCVHVKHPHKIIVVYLQVLECERNQQLVQTAWNYMNDSLRTDVFVRFHPESIACACICLAARTLEIPLPNRPHWFLLFGATEEEIQEICIKILQLYTRRKADLTQLEAEVERRRRAMEEAHAHAHPPGATPLVDSTAGFSPVAKPESPKVNRGNKSSPPSVKNIRTQADSPVNGRSDSESTSRSSKSPSRSRSRSDSPPRQVHRSGLSHSSRRARDCIYPPQKPPKSPSRSSPRSRSQSRERADSCGKYRKRSRSCRDEQLQSCEHAGRCHKQALPGHSRHRR
ncbi:cyclin-L2 isoform X3 [Ochotona princeps]|uniref:cyclin-L2 isoform X3 n=1 Tax=Ochotona princeps TaxID=9978 RepID=UPI0027148FC9|nr:cyclin-L2 isoform X3 [Ochotona princeps]